MLFIGNKPEITFKTNMNFCNMRATFGLNPDFCLVLSTSQTYYDTETSKFHEIKIIRNISLKKFIANIKCDISEVFEFNNEGDKKKFFEYKNKVIGRIIFGKRI